MQTDDAITDEDDNSTCDETEIANTEEPSNAVQTTNAGDATNKKANTDNTEKSISQDSTSAAGPTTASGNDEVDVDDVNASAEGEFRDVDGTKDVENNSNGSNISAEDLNDMNDDSLADEMDVSDVSSSIAENEGESKTPSPRKKPKKRQPPIMIGYKKRRKVHSNKKPEDEQEFGIKPKTEPSSQEAESTADEKSDDSRKSEQSPPMSPEHVKENPPPKSTRSVTLADKYCWICHRDGANSFKCIACPRVYHQRCLVQQIEDPNNFHCPECSAILKADNVNTRSPIMQAVNLDQLCTLLKHVVNLLKSVKDAHYFIGPVDTKEFPHYREYVVYPMDLSVLEKNCQSKVYGCTEAFLADMKWIVHNSVVFNTKAAKITNVAKNLLKICKREVAEIETCAECYYNLLARKDTWFIEVCKRPHLLVWARLKGYPPWPAKALKCKDEMVDCRFFGAHDKAWVPLKDCYLYSKVSPQPVKIKPGSHLDEGLQEIEKHIKKLKDKYGVFVYPEHRVPYNPTEELEQLQTMLPNFNPNFPTSTKYLIHPDRVKSTITPKTLFDETRPTTAEQTTSKQEPSTDESTIESTSAEANDSASETAKMADDESSTSTEPTSVIDESKITDDKERPKPTSIPALVPMGCKDKTRDTDTEAEESDSSKSSKSQGETKHEPIKRKLVSVKSIGTINASVPEKTAVLTTAPKLISVATPPTATPVAMHIGNGVVSLGNNSPINVTQSIRSIRKVIDSKAQSNVGVKADDKSKPKNIITVRNFASMDKCDTLMNKTPVRGIPPRKEPSKVTPTPVVVPDVDFNLDKVKDEPMESDGSSVNEDPIFIKEVPAKIIPSKPTLKNVPNTEVTVRKRSIIEDKSDAVDSKKSKNDNCRTVNITENVTLSLINNQAALETQPPPLLVTKPQALLKAKPPPPKAYAISRASMVDTSSNDTVTNVITKPIRIAPAPAPVSKNVVFPTASQAQQQMQQSRICNGVTLNGTAAPRSSVLLIQPPRVAQPKNVQSQNGIGGVIDQCMSEFHTNFRKAFEDTLDKIAGKGDQRAKVILLQKEIENLKRNHELMIDEIKRDYEVQIAELRAASIAQKKFDLASERLKFEQEKERAVKEAKSKQWCSNCQKSANYYCCWNTAYCDFECQKEHWNQHMHVCKNDVKKKTAECSENEPPRIMMQNDVSSNYSLLNGYDKPSAAVYTFQNSSGGGRSNGGTAKVQMKNSSAKATQRPLLPRVTATVTCTPSLSSTPMAATFVDSSFQNIGASTITPVRNTAVGSVTMHPFIRQTQQFHKSN